MRYAEISAQALVKEAIVHSRTLDDGTRFIVAQDPTAPQFQAMITKSKQRRLRMLCRDGHVYCWDAYYGDHDIVGHYILGFTGGPSDIGVRLEATTSFIEYGNRRFSFDLRGVDTDTEWRDAVQEAAREQVGKIIATLLHDYPRLEKLVGDLQLAIHIDVTWRDNTKSDLQYVEIGTLDSFHGTISETSSALLKRTLSCL